MDQEHPSPSWAEIAGGIGNAFGGMILALEAAVLLPGLLPLVALTIVALVPFVVLGGIVALPVALVVFGVRRLSRAGRRRSRRAARASAARPR